MRKLSLLIRNMLFCIFDEYDDKWYLMIVLRRRFLFSYLIIFNFWTCVFMRKMNLLLRILWFWCWMVMCYDYNHWYVVKKRIYMWKQCVDEKIVILMFDNDLHMINIDVWWKYVFIGKMRCSWGVFYIYYVIRSSLMSKLSLWLCPTGLYYTRMYTGLLEYLSCFGFSWIRVGVLSIVFWCGVYV